MDYNGEEYQSLCAELFALCCNYTWRQSVTSAGYAITCDQAQ
jgi:hypothetical protein